MVLRVYGSTRNDIFYSGDNIDGHIPGYDKDRLIYSGNDAAARLYGLSGDDEFYIHKPGKNFFYIDAGTGNDLVRSVGQTGTTARLGIGDDRYEAIGEIDGRIYGGSGNDVFFTSGIGSRVYGESGDDRFSIHYDMDLRQEKNLYHGGSGTDTIQYEAVPEIHDGMVINLDKKIAYFTDDKTQKDQIIGFENANGSEGMDELVGNAVANTLSGSWNDDIVKGLGGNDILYGDSIAYLSNGGAGGNDRLIGGAGNDILIGQGGADVLEGGTGADTFRFVHIDDSMVANRDVIKDFSSKQKDIIDMSAIDSNTTVRGNQALDFIGNKLFTGKAGELNYRAGILSADTDGDRIADFQVKLIGVKLLAESDFLL